MRCSRCSASSGMSSSGNLSQYSIASSNRGKKASWNSRISIMVLAIRLSHRSDSVGKHQASAYGSSSAKALGSNVSAMVRPHRAAFGSIVGHPVADHLMQMTDQDLLIVERKFVDDAGLKRSLRAAEHPGVLQRKLLEHHRGNLVFDALAHAARRVKRGVGLEPVRVVRSRPIPVKQIPAAVNQDLQVREDLEIADPPRLDATGVETRRQLAQVRSPPRADESTARRPFDRVHVLRVHQPPAGACRGHHAVWTVDLEMCTLKPGVGLAHLGWN